MSLDDRFNPNDGSFVDALDSAIFEFNKKIATKWQNKTHRNKADLERVLYLGSAVAIVGHVVNTGNFLMTIPAADATFRGSIETTRPKSAKEEEIGCEAAGLPGKTIKYLDVICYGLGIIGTLSGVASLVAGAVSGDNKFYMDSLNPLSFGLGTFGWVSAKYISKSDIGTPPPKPKKKSVIERIRNLLPQPTPEPVPIEIY